MGRKVLITGAGGLLGWHMRVFLSTIADVEVVALARAGFNNPKRLQEAVSAADLIFHFAGVNRGSDNEIANGNPMLARELVRALEETESRADVAYSSSIHENLQTVYGQSKNAAGKILGQWAQKSGAIYYHFVLPHIFGEGGKPNYNSVISTFCHQIASNKQPQIDADGQIEPIHAQRLSEKMFQHCQMPAPESSKIESSKILVEGQKMKVSEMLSRLTYVADSYRAGIIPDLRDEFSLDLFNTYRSYLYPQHYPVHLTKHTDARGSLVEAVKEKNGGQMFFSTTQPNVTRGNHFHRHKVERFLVVSGKADICIRKIGTDDVEIFSVEGDKPAFIDIPTLHTHNITNTGEGELLTLFWVHELFDPQKSDTYAIDV